MIEKDYDEGGYNIYCDYCSNEEHVMYKSFEDVISFLRRTRWESKKITGVWTHKCPVCRGQKGIESEI